MNPADYWKANTKLVHITPNGERFPEVGLFPVLKKVCKGIVFEFGCGDGRLSTAFDSSQYYGYDINTHALKQAKINNPDYHYVSEFKQADTVLAYTVLLHIDDDDITDVISLLKSYKRIVIGEIMGRQWRRSGNPPVFNREIRDYLNLVGIVPDIYKIPYPRYNCDLDILVFDND